MTRLNLKILNIHYFFFKKNGMAEFKISQDKQKFHFVSLHNISNVHFHKNTKKKKKKKVFLPQIWTLD